MAITHTFASHTSVIDGAGVWADVSLTVPAGTKKLIILTGGEDAAGTIGSITSMASGGEALTKIDAGNSNVSGADLQRVEGWFLDNPTAGARTLSFVGAGPITATFHVTAYYLDGDPSTGQPEAKALFASGADPSALATTSLTNGALIVGVVNAGASVSISSVTNGTLEANVSSGGSRHGTASEIKATAGLHTMSFDWSSSPARVAGLIIAVHPSGSAPASVDASTAAWTALDAGGTPGGVSRSADTGTAAWSALDTTAIGSSIAAIDVSVGVWSSLNATPMAGAVSAPTDVSAAVWTSLDATASAGGAPSIEPVDASVSAWVANAVVAIGVLLAPLDASAAVWSALDCTPVGGAVVQAMDVATAAWTAPDAFATDAAAAVVQPDTGVAVWTSLDALPVEVTDPYENILIDSQAEIEHELATIEDGISTTQRPGALAFDYREAYTLGPIAIGDANSGILGWAWYVRVEGNSVRYARSNNPYTGYGAESELFTFVGAPILELDVAFEQNGRIVIWAERATGVGGSSEIWAYWFKPSLADFTFEMFDAGRTPKTVLDNPNDTTISDVHVGYIKDGVGLLTRRQSELYATPHATVFTDSTDWFLEEFARNRGNRLVAILSHRSGDRYYLDRIESTLYPFYPADSATAAMAMIGGELDTTSFIDDLNDIGSVETAMLMLNTSTLAIAIIIDELNDPGAVEAAMLALSSSTLAVVVLIDELNDIGSVETVIDILNTSTLVIVVIEDILNDAGATEVSMLALSTSTLEVA